MTAAKPFPRCPERTSPTLGELRAQLAITEAERDLLAGAREQLGTVGKLGLEPEAVTDHDHIAIARFPAGLDDTTCGGRLDRRAHRRRHIDPFVRSSDMQYGVFPHCAERAGEPAGGGQDGRRGGHAVAVMLEAHPVRLSNP